MTLLRCLAMSRTLRGFVGLAHVLERFEPIVARAIEARALKLVREADDEAVSVRHPHLRQRLGIHRLVLVNQLVEREYVGGQRVDFVVRERPGLLPGHRATDEVEESRGITPEVS